VVASFEINDKGNLIVTYTDGTTADLGHVVGANGAPGDKGDKGDKGDIGETGSGCGGEIGIGSAITVAVALMGVGAFVIGRRIRSSKKNND